MNTQQWRDLHHPCDHNHSWGKMCLGCSHATRYPCDVIRVLDAWDSEVFNIFNVIDSEEVAAGEKIGRINRTLGRE